MLMINKNKKYYSKNPKYVKPYKNLKTKPEFVKNKKKIYYSYAKYIAKKKAKAKFFRLKKYFSFKLAGRPFYAKKFRFSNKKYGFFTFHFYPNNIFCSFKRLLPKKNKEKNRQFKLINVASSEKYKIKISKKSLRHKAKFVILSFFKELRLKLKKSAGIDKYIHVKLVAPTRIKKKIIPLIFGQLKGHKTIFEVIGRKVFNGCRGNTKRRKKQRRARLYK